MIYAILYVLIFFSGADTESDNEYCQFESFTPKCGISEVILMRKALFGRMREGRCITKKEIKSFGALIHDPKYFGCSVDVLDLFHERCSLKQDCLVKVSDASLKNYDPCQPGLILHLEAEHICISAYQTEDTRCLLTASEKPRYILASSLMTNHCGQTNYPWIIETAKGQRIMISFFSTNTKATEVVTQCNEVGVQLQDGNLRNNVSICSNQWSNEDLVDNHLLPFKSSSNVIKLFVNGIKSLKASFALKVQAEGCLDIIPPEDTWLKRSNDDIVIGCYSSKQTWYLRCENGQWTGTVGNCSTPIDSSSTMNKKLDKSDEIKMIMPKNQQVLAIVSICGAGVVICSLIICVGAVCARRYSVSTKLGKPKFVNHNFEPPYNQHQTYNPGVYSAKYESDSTERQTQNFSGDDKTYFVLEENGTEDTK